MRARDTSPAAHAVQVEAWRRMGPEARGEMAVRMSEASRQLARDGIAARHPDYTPEDVHHALMVLLYGDLARRALGPDARDP